MASSTEATVNVTVQEALMLPSLAAGAPEILTHPERTASAIRWAHVGEVPSLPSVLRGGELVLTTGAGFGDDDRALERFAAELGERDVAALVLELGSRFTTVPKALVESAERHGLLLIGLHREISFVEVTEAINDELHKRELGMARQVEQLREGIIKLLIDGHGAPDILKRLATEIENPVVLERDDGSLLFHATFANGSGDVIAGWDRLKSNLPGSPDEMSVAVPSAGDGPSAQLHALAIDGPLGEFTQAALSCAAGLLGVATRQSRQEQALAARERGNLLLELIDSELTETEITRRVAAMGFPPRVPHLLPCVFRAPELADESIWAMVWNSVRHELATRSVPFLGGSTPNGEEILLVVGLTSPTQRERQAETVAKLFAREVKRSIGSAAGYLTVGGSSRSWTGVIENLRETIQAAEPQRRPERLWHDATRPDLDRLLWNLRETRQLQQFVERILSPLIEHDLERNTKLLPTLEAYLYHGGHKTETARALFIERQSVYHRLEKIESLLETSLEDESARLGLHLAVRARGLVTDAQPNPAPDDAD
jgi:PucR family transcriptional regulator, purine catabolism regulatory protein